MSTRQKDFGVLKMLSGRYMAKKSGMIKLLNQGLFNEALLTLICVGFSRVRFVVTEGGGEITPCQKLVRIML